LLHFIPGAGSFGYQPNDKERIVIVAIIIANTVPLISLATATPIYR